MEPASWHIPVLAYATDDDARIDAVIESYVNDALRNTGFSTLVVDPSEEDRCVERLRREGVFVYDVTDGASFRTDDGEMGLWWWRMPAAYVHGVVLAQATADDGEWCGWRFGEWMLYFGSATTPRPAFERGARFVETTYAHNGIDCVAVAVRLT